MHKERNLQVNKLRDTNKYRNNYTMVLQLENVNEHKLIETLQLQLSPDTARL